MKMCSCEESFSYLSELEAHRGLFEDGGFLQAALRLVFSLKASGQSILIIASIFMVSSCKESLRNVAYLELKLC